MNGGAKAWIAAIISVCMSGEVAGSRPNLVYVLMDDTDVMLGSDKMLKKGRELVADEGALFEQFRTLSPKCTPSRTGQLAGRHYHNVRPNGGSGGDPPGTGRGLNQTTMFEPDALFPMLHSNGYWTSIVGKVHNDQASFLCKPKNDTAPFTHVHTACRPCGGYWRTQYTVKQVGESVPRLVELNATDWSTYSEGQFGNASIKFMREAVAAKQPFFAYIGTTGPHLPSIPAPWHLPEVNSWNVTAPRLPNFNQHYPDHHPMVADAPVVDPDKVHFMDEHYRDRLGTLLSIDDLIANVVHELESLGVLDNTYIIVSSDHGYHIGNWRIPMEKMWPYETDIRIPAYMRGPGIPAGQRIRSMAMNLDILPTFLDLAGIPLSPEYDGRSLVPLVKGSEAERKAAADGWRTRTVIAFAEGATQEWGHTSISNGTISDPQSTSVPPLKSDSGKTYLFDDPANQWRMLRVANTSHNVSYVEWDPVFLFEKIAFHAFYDLNKDPYEQENLYQQLPTDQQRIWHEELDREFTCRGHHGTRTDCS